MESFSDEELSRQLSEASEDSFASANDEFLPYDQSIEPIATEEEAAEYAELVAQEEEEEETLWSRFSGEDAVVNWFVTLLLTSAHFMVALLNYRISTCSF